jgi:hypothetical protein
MDGGTAAPAIGDYYQGGIVAYIFVYGEPGYDPYIPHGLIASTSDQSTGIEWWDGSYSVTGATGSAIGKGLFNTNTIIARQQGATPTNYAAGLARAYTGEGYTDWYLPSKDELNKLFLNRAAIGVFASRFYWSSTEVDEYGAWTQHLTNGYENYPDKRGKNYVRAVRAF